ncbi:cytochrome P450 [Crucibulum laeve]|uniref:Cytochrome P450 n=1 Tax=Crucibulum laeve TaxID=68775 RepID=A0A5C3LTX7_9AGAR|nr:cytochrome P450 [Crucibulum laeve]
MLPILALALAAVVYVYVRNRKASNLPLPPGPKKLPVLGNILDLPTSFEWETYEEWGKKYNSDILHLNAAGINLIVLNSIKVTNDLLDKRSAIYSGRPGGVMVLELVGWNWLFLTMGYGDAWKERRRLFTRHFHSSGTSVHRPRETLFVRRLLAQLLDGPSKGLELTREMIGGITLSLAYGINIRPSNDPFIELAEHAITGLAESATPGLFLVDALPFLKYIPEGIPGAGFQKKARQWRELQQRFRTEPFERTVKDMADGTAQPSFVSEALDALEGVPDAKRRREVIRDTAGMFFAGGSDTTVSAIHTFILAMLRFPEIQAKAQEELDRVVTASRLPEYADEVDLPYVSAIVKEVLRWRPVTPFPFPHLLIEDDVYDGYHIPKGSIILANSWAMLRNEEDYPDPDAFKPERFLKDGKLDPSVRDPTTMAFGFGRRECPGKAMALASLWLTAASILHTFEIVKPLDKDGNPIEPDMKYSSSLVCHPIPFKCIIKPRSQEAERLVRAVADNTH